MLVAIVVGIIIALRIFSVSFSLPSQLLARINGVGSRPAPIPVMKVVNVSLQTKNDLTASQINNSIRSAVANQQITPKFSVREYHLQWRVSVENGSLATVMAQVFVPVGQPNQQFPLIVYGPGTTGLADRCAPSRENLARGNMGDYRNYIISEASQGYVVVMPNYEGFDNTRNQHYFNKDSEARTMLSAVQATVTAVTGNRLPVNTNAIFLGGYSQGGHAAFSAADYATTYLKGLKISGVFGHGPTTNIAEYLKNNPNLAAYFFASYSEYYPQVMNPKTILEPRWQEYLEVARKICVDEGFGINSTTLADVFADPFEQALRNNSLATNFPEIDAVFQENNAGTKFRGIPVMIVQGSTDPVVTKQSQDAFVSSLCSRGVSVDYKVYPGVHHFQTRQRSFHDTNAWIDAISQGRSVTNFCQQ